VNRYRARVHREGSWWVIEVDGVGVTQAKRLDQVSHMARDLVAAMLDIDADEVEVESTFEVSPDIDALLTAVKAAREAAKITQQEAANLMRQAARRLVAERLPVRDIARLVGVSFQRAHQLATDKSTEPYRERVAGATARVAKQKAGTRRELADR